MKTYNAEGLANCPFCGSEPFWDVKPWRYSCENKLCKKQPKTRSTNDKDKAQELWNREDFDLELQQ